MPTPTAPEATVEAPAPAQIALGPHADIYGELAPSTPSEPQAPESTEASAPEPTEQTPDHSEPEAQEPKADEQSTRRRKGEEAYERGLREGRERYERELRERTENESRQRAQQEFEQHFDKVLADLESHDFTTSEAAKRELAKILKPERQAQALKAQTRNDVLADLAKSFASIKELDGLDDEGYQTLHKAKDPTDLAKSAYELGRKAEKLAFEEKMAGLEAELESLRGRAAASALSPEKANGTTGSGSQLTYEQYIALSPKEARKISAAEIDRMTADHFARQRRGR